MKKLDFKLGASVAASWAWGTSLIMGMEIAQQKGVIPFLIWAIANCLTLSLFGEMYRRKILTKEVWEKKPIKYLAIVIQMFCMVIQLNIINNTLTALNVSHSYWVTVGIGVLFVAMMYKKGLSTSIFTDNFQWWISIVSMIALIILGNVGGAEHYIFIDGDASGIKWAIWSACVLLSGPIGDVMHWQRGEVDKTGTGFHIGAILFALYLSLVFILAHFRFNAIMNIILLIPVLGITTSTVDSIAVALHEAANKKVGTAIGIFLCVFWGVFKEIGIIEIWSKFGVYRVGFAFVILIVSFYYFFKKRGKKNGVQHGGGVHRA